MSSSLAAGPQGWRPPLNCDARACATSWYSNANNRQAAYLVIADMYGFGWREFQRALTGPAYARRLLGAAEGIDIRTGVSALGLEANARVRALTPEGIHIFEGRCVLLALGTRETPRAARLVSGTRPWGVFTTGALQQMVYLAGLKPCTRAVIVGSELVSFSSLLTLRHAGIKAVAMLEESAHTVAPRPAQWIARAAFGTRVLTQTNLIADSWRKTGQRRRDRTLRPARTN